MTGPRPTKGLLLAGGHGVRLRPLTFQGNKHLLPIANTPMIHYGIRHLQQAGVKEVGIVLGTIREGIEEAIGDGTQFGLRTTFIHQGEPKGLAHAVLCAREFLGEESFLMYLGDNLLEHGAQPYLERYAQGDAKAVIGAVEVPDPTQFGVVELGPSGEILSLEEKPRNPRSHLALVGVYLFSPEIHPIVRELRPSARGELEITDAIRLLHERTGGVRVIRLQGWWKDTGRPSDLVEANERVLASRPASEFLRLGEVRPTARLSGPVAIGEGSLVGEGTTVEGPAILGKGVRLSDGAHIGPFTSVGDGAVIRRAHVERSIVMENVEIDAAVRIRNSIIGRGSRILAGTASTEGTYLLLGDASQVRL